MLPVRRLLAVLLIAGASLGVFSQTASADNPPGFTCGQGEWTGFREKLTLKYVVNDNGYVSGTAHYRYFRAYTGGYEEQPGDYLCTIYYY